MDALYHAGGFLIVWVGIAGLSVFGLCLGTALGKIIYTRMNGSPEEIKIGGAVHIGLPKSMLSGAVQAAITLGVPIAFLWAFHHIAQTNFGAFLSFR